MRREHGTVAVTIEPDLREFKIALRRVGTHVGNAWRNLKRAMGIIQRAIDPRICHGPDMFTDDGRWQSTMCGAWLHDSCGLPGSCDCTCHGGSLR